MPSWCSEHLGFYKRKKMSHDIYLVNLQCSSISLDLNLLWKTKSYKTSVQSQSDFSALPSWASHSTYLRPPRNRLLQLAELAVLCRMERLLPPSVEGWRQSAISETTCICDSKTQSPFFTTGLITAHQKSKTQRLKDGTIWKPSLLTSLLLCTGYI